MARYTLSLHLAQPLSCSSSMRSRQAEHTTPCDPAPLRALSHRPLDADLFSQQTYSPRSRAGPDSRPGCLGRMALPRFLKRAAPLRALGRDASAQCGMRRGGREPSFSPSIVDRLASALPPDMGALRAFGEKRWQRFRDHARAAARRQNDAGLHQEPTRRCFFGADAHSRCPPAGSTSGIVPA